MPENSKRKKYNLELPDDVLSELADEYNDDHPAFKTISLAVYKLNQAEELLRVQNRQIFKIRDAYDRGRYDLVKTYLKRYEASLATLNDTANDNIKTEINYLSQLVSLAGTPKAVN